MALRAVFLLAWFCLMASAHPADPADAAQASDAVLVNTYTTGAQHSAEVICEPGGGYVVTWTSENPPERSTRRRRLAINGSPIGTEYIVPDSSVTTAGVRGAALVGARAKAAFDLADEGRFVVASFHEEYIDGCAGNYGGSTTTTCGDFSRNSYVSIQRFDSDGLPLGTEIIRQAPGNENLYPDVAMLPGAEFVVAWSSCYSYPGDYMARPCSGSRVVAEAFEETGVSRFRFDVSDVGSGYVEEHRPSLAGHDDGSFTVIWGGRDYDLDSEARVLASRYRSDASAEFEELNLGPGGSVFNPRTDAAVGNGDDIAVAWTGPSFDLQSDVFATRIGGPLPTDACPSEPSPACRPARPGRGRLLLRAGNRAAREPRIRWTWVGRTPSADSFLNPQAAGTTSRFCVYDGLSEGPGPAATTVDSGGDAIAPGWEHPRRRLYVYQDPQGVQDGVTAIRLRAARSTITRNRLRADGPDVVLPQLPMQAEAIVQLFVSDGVAVECWQASYASPQRNDGDVFRQRGASPS